MNIILYYIRQYLVQFISKYIFFEILIYNIYLLYELIIIHRRKSKSHLCAIFNILKQIKS